MKKSEIRFKLILLVCLIIFISGCVGTKENDPYGYNYGIMEKEQDYSEIEDENKPPSSYVRVQSFRSGDTFIMTNGKILKLAGISTRKLGEPYHKKAKDFAKFLIGLKLLRLVWVKDTKKVDNVWKANVIIKQTNLMISVNEQLVKHGLAEVTVTEPLIFQSLNLDNGGKLITLSNKNNQAVFNKLIELQKEAQRKKLNIWSDKYEE